VWTLASQARKRRSKLRWVTKTKRVPDSVVNGAVLAKPGHHASIEGSDRTLRTFEAQFNSVWRYEDSAGSKARGVQAPTPYLARAGARLSLQH